MSEWIKCSDRLPRYGDPVLIFTGVVQNTTFFLDASEEEDCGWWECVADETLTVPFGDVAEWRPLPEPPKGER